MRIAIAPFEPERHLAPASRLLAERHRRDRARQPLLPAAYEQPDACIPHMESVFHVDGWHGVVAEIGGEMAGFALMTPQNFGPTHLLANFFPPRGVSMPHHAHAVKAGMEYDLYRELYGALAAHFVGHGYFEHGVNLPATDDAARDAWASLGFGRVMACAVRGVEPPERAAASIEVHQASSEDAEVIYALNEELTLHHARSPIFNPYMRESDQASHDFQKNLLNDPDTNAHWVAYEEGRPVGMNTFMAPLFLSPLAVPEKTIYLFQGIVTQEARAGGVGTALLSKGAAWARERGFERIALHFASANISGAKFWQSSGFVPIEYGLRRHIDERIAWGNR